jgi:predicted SAM-dependent methyltransferase
MRSLPDLSYRAVGFHPAPHLDDGAADLTNLERYSDAGFDGFICSHVLEHVSDAAAGARELFRITRPGGQGIVMVPIPLDLQQTQENEQWTSEAQRWKYFGQGDHLRVFSKSGLTSVLESVGFRVDEWGIEHFGAATFQRFAISPRSVLYVVTK